jgi:hypothetical protein
MGKSHYKEPHRLCRSPNIVRATKSRILRWAEHLRPNIGMDLEEIDVNTRKLIDSAQRRDNWRALVNATLNLLVP